MMDDGYPMSPVNGGQCNPRRTLGEHGVQARPLPQATLYILPPQEGLGDSRVRVLGQSGV
jgi:hypothetical protein